MPGIPDIEKDLDRRKARAETSCVNDDSISIEELDAAIRNFSKGKAPSPDGFTTDLIKDLDSLNRLSLLELLNKWWNQGQLPPELSEALVASLYKKGDPNKQENYRPIGL